MNLTDTLNEQSADKQVTLIQTGFLTRLIARTIDFIIVVALLEIVPRIGYFAGLAYLFMADGLFNGRSVGKRLTGLRVVRFTDAHNFVDCGYQGSVYRNFPFAAGYILCGIIGAIPLIGWIFSFAIAVVVLVFESLLIIGSDMGMRLGDEIAKTQVVEDKQGGVNVK